MPDTQPPMSEEPRWIGMPSVEEAKAPEPAPAESFHMLDELYPDAPIPNPGGRIIRRAILHDSSGLPELFSWVGSGDMVLVELARLMSREIEFAACVAEMQAFVEGDLAGQVAQIGDDRIVLLPRGMRGVRGVEAEAFGEA